MTLMREIQNFFNIIPEPSEVYQDLNITPRWRIPAAFLLIISPAIGFLTIPAAIEPLRNIYHDSFDARTAEIALQTSTRYLTIIYALLEPLVKIFRWVILSAAIFILILLHRKIKSSSFSKVFSIVAYSETLFHLMEILTILIIYVRGIDNITDQSDLMIFSVLNYFIDGNSVSHALYTLMSIMNPFTIWYIAVLSRGIQVSTTIRYLSSLKIVTIAWITWLLLSLLESVIISSITGLFF